MSVAASKDDDKNRISREEICKRFYLPERKTKIDTILKLQQDHEKAMYCVCQSIDSSKFMIGCEKCDGWYHGECIGLAETDAKRVKKWYCFDCTALHNLKVVYFSDKMKKSFHKKKKEKKHRKRVNYPYKRRDSFSCGQCCNCLQNKDCGNVDKKMLFKNHPSQQHIKEEIIGKFSFSEEQKRLLYNDDKKIQIKKETTFGSESKQCFNSNCSDLCRVNSKYCSDACGMAVAKLRLWMVYKKYLQQYTNPSVAQQRDVAKLEDIDKQKMNSAMKIEGLNLKEHTIRRLIEKAKRLPITEFEEEIEDDSKHYCVTCGWEVPSRSIIRHMENCFRKAETLNTVENVTKSNSKYCKIFCDHYNAAKNTYCMRLRYLCPYHFKRGKPGNNEVCGCPIIKTFCTNMFLEAEKFCQKPKSVCRQHFNWELLAISEIDLEHQREQIKFANLIQQEDDIVDRMSSRDSILGLLLHSTQEH